MEGSVKVLSRPSSSQRRIKTFDPSKCQHIPRLKKMAANPYLLINKMILLTIQDLTNYISDCISSKTKSDNPIEVKIIEAEDYRRRLVSLTILELSNILACLSPEMNMQEAKMIIEDSNNLFDNFIGDIKYYENTLRNLHKQL